MEVAAYLHRVGYQGSVAPDLATLRALQRAHLAQIPYENLDVQMGRPLTLDPKDAFAKLVTHNRGGWCYEMNGLLGWVLTAIGFRVTHMTGAVLKAERGASALGNHLVLAVDLDETYLVDVGLGDGPSEPIPLQAGTYRHGWRTLRLEALPDGWWRFHNAQNAFAPSFDFQHRPADWSLLQERCRWQQTSPQSRFVQNAICVRHKPDAIVALIGRVLKTANADGITEALIETHKAYADILTREFGIHQPEFRDLWPRIQGRHREVFGA